MIAEGEIEFWDVNQKTGRPEGLMYVLKKGDMFGEAGMLFRSRRAWTTVSRNKCKVYRLNRETFCNKVLDSPNIRGIFDQ